MSFDGFLSTVDTIFYGRISYDNWGNYQPTNDANEVEIKLWEGVHSKKKYVFSTQPKIDNNAEYINVNIIKKWKR
ncbi:hypothetical protein LEP1GSC195_3597 [Leptospira wolbachii serovar Codice str. CDC]|uniref:Uncharacterized protein n=2 Tax=Leptospira TaxID=171 RepID=R9A0B5_9LEPT|nr:hypothetical protein LEP1GSC195_3597 [Leptospira wolbachii serovar Codice str. CDC]